MESMFVRRDLLLDLYLVTMGLLGLFCVNAVSNHFFLYQSVFFVISLVAYFVISSFKTKTLNFFLVLLYFVTLIGLLYLFLFGSETRGSIAWINFGIINFQPSEFAKISVIFFTSKILSSIYFFSKKFVYLGISILPILLLIFLQPDFGNFFVIIFSVSFIFFVGFLDLKRLLVLFTVFLIFSILIYSFILKPYQKLRIDSFIFQNNVNISSNYNLNQSKIAIGSGGIFGRGHNNNTQVMLNFLPEAHTDFIFAAVSEKYGFIFSVFLSIVFLGLVLWVFYKYILNAKSAYFLYLACGVFAVFIVQVFLNLGMSVGLLPITGLTLPFVSYGGSSLVTFYILFAILQKTNYS